MRSHRTLVLGLCLTGLVGVGGPRSAHAVGEAVVYPTGDPAVDVARVQAAVDSADEVLLKATDEFTGAPRPFDFGESSPGGGFIVLSRDIAIRGEMVGPNRTTITGGFAPLRGLASNPVASSISGIDFESPGVAALFVTGATGIEFVDNRVRDVIGLPDWLPGISKGQGVWVVGLYTVSGEILIADNSIDGVDAQNGYGLALFGFSADARIERNTIRGVDTAGILVGNHTGRVWVTDNQIAPGPARYQTDYGHGSGIIVGNAYGGTSSVRNNTIECVNPWSLGIFVAASSSLYGDIQENAVIERNRVTVRGSWSGGIALMGSVTGTLVRANELSGEGQFALAGLVWITPADIVDSNTFRGNDTSSFESTVADVLFDVNTHENLVDGRATSVLDLGVDNWISGTSTGPPPMLQGGQSALHRSPSLAEESRVPASLRAALP